MTADALHTYVYAPPRSLSYAAQTLPPKAAHSIRTYEIVLTSLLQLLRQEAIASAAVDAEAPLVVHAASQASTAVTVVLGGGGVGARPGNLCIALLFADGTREDVVLAQPIQAASPEIPDDPVTLGSQLITIDYQPLELTQLASLPGGAVLGDQVLTMRGHVLGLTAPGQGGGGESGGGAVLTAAGPISGHRAIMVTPAGLAAHADPSSAAYNFAGISTGAAEAGANVSLAEAGGVIAEPSWAWTPGRAVFVGAAGTLTQVPPSSGVSHQVGQALAATILLVQPYSLFRLS